MLFIPTRRINILSTRRGVSRPSTTTNPGENWRQTWMVKIFAMGITLLLLLYGLVLIGGFQYFAYLTSVTLLAFLLSYVVWCILHRNKAARQVQDSSTTDRSIDFMGRYFQRVIF
jgi:fatty-acid desaturase